MFHRALVLFCTPEEEEGSGFDWVGRRGLITALSLDALAEKKRKRWGWGLRGGMRGEGGGCRSATMAAGFSIGEEKIINVAGD